MSSDFISFQWVFTELNTSNTFSVLASMVDTENLPVHWDCIDVENEKEM